MKRRKMESPRRSIANSNGAKRRSPVSPTINSKKKPGLERKAPAVPRDNLTRCPYCKAASVKSAPQNVEKRANAFWRGLSFGEFVGIATLVFTVFASAFTIFGLMAAMMALLLNMQESNRKTTEDVLRLQAQILEMRMRTSQPAPIVQPDREPTPEPNRRAPCIRRQQRQRRH